MRRLTIILLSSFFVLALAGGAGALTIDPDPVNHTRGSGDTGGPLDADIDLISIVDDIMTLQLTVNPGSVGSIDEIDVTFLLDSWTVPTAYSFIIGAGTNAGAGVDVVANVATGGTKAEFTFDAGNNGKVDAGETTDEFWIQFDGDILETWVGAIGFDAGGLGVDETYTVVPEPGTALLMLFAATIGLAVRRRG